MGTVLEDQNHCAAVVLKTGNPIRYGIEQDRAAGVKIGGDHSRH